MSFRTAVAWFASCALGVLNFGAQADTLDQIRKSGEIRLGYRIDAPPMASNDANGQAVGYSVDLCRRIATAVKEDLKLANLKITMVPVDPSTGTQWTREFLTSLKSAGTPLTDMLQTALEPGYPMWDEIAAMVWLAPEIVTRADTLYVDFETSQTAAYGDTLSWADAWRPHLGEQAQRVILTVDRARMEAAMRALYRRPVRH